MEPSAKLVNPASTVGNVRTDGRCQGVGGTEHDTASLDSIKSLPDHANNRAGGHVLDQTREEGLSLEISVVYARSSIT